MFGRSFLFCVLLVLSGLSYAKSKNELVEAVRLAEKYVVDHHIPNSDRHLVGVAWHEDFKNPQSSHWIVSWAPNDSRSFDAELIVRVYDNGQITYQDSWA